MSDNNQAKFAISRCGGIFEGEFETRESAINDAIMHGWQKFYVGKMVKPTQPEFWFEASDWLEMVSCQDDYPGDWSTDWDRSTAAQRDELTQEVRAVLAAWLDRHNLRPVHFIVPESEEITVCDGVEYESPHN